MNDVVTTPPQSAPTNRTPIRDWFNSWPMYIRIVATLVVGIVVGYLILGLLFIAFIMASGCFMECSDAQPLAGAALAVVPCVLFSGWMAMAAWATEHGHLARKFFTISLRITTPVAVLIALTAG